MPRWVQLGAEGDSYAQRSEELLATSSTYTIRKKDGNIQFALKYLNSRKKPLIHVSNWMSIAQSGDDVDLTDLLRSQALTQQFQIPPDVMKSLVDHIDSSEGVKLFHRFRQTIFFSSREQLPEVLRHLILPQFFKRYPSGIASFISASEDFHKAFTALRVMGATLDIANRDYEEMKKIGGVRTLSDTQGSSTFYTMKHLNVPLGMLLPKLYGFTTSRVNGAFLFLLDQPIPDVREFYPRSGLEFFRSETSGLFRESRHDLNLQEITPASIDNFRLVNQDFTLSEIRSFIREYLLKLEGFAGFMIDPSNFIKSGSDNVWAGLSHYKAWLTWGRICDELILLLTDDTAYLRKAALFRVLDQLSSMAAKDKVKQTDFFKRLLLPKDGNDPILDGLRSYSSPVVKHLEFLLGKTRDELRNSVLKSIYVPGRLNNAQWTVTLSDGRVIGADEYVVNTVRELRNTYHGYDTDKFNLYLSISSGDTPDSLPLIGVLAFLALLAKPQLFFRKYW